MRSRCRHHHHAGTCAYTWLHSHMICAFGPRLARGHSWFHVYIMWAFSSRGYILNCSVIILRLAENGTKYCVEFLFYCFCALWPAHTIFYWWRVPRLTLNQRYNNGNTPSPEISSAFLCRICSLISHFRWIGQIFATRIHVSRMQTLSHTPVLPCCNAYVHL